MNNFFFNFHRLITCQQSLTYISINGSYWPNTLITFLSLVGVIIVIVHVFSILLNSMVHLTDLDYIFVSVFLCNG